MKLQDYRREYLQQGLRRAALDSDPIKQFEAWLQQAMAAGLQDPTAMTLATVNPQGQPSQRIVLLKQVDQQGFVFFTNKNSTKGEEIADNPKVSLHFPWHGLERQVKVLGVAHALNKGAVKAYFASRPKESQLATWASQQSQPIPSREALEQQFHRLQQQYANSDAPCPDYWGGYSVTPEIIEFWQGGQYRLHDRFEYRRQKDQTWKIQRLAP